MTPSLLLMVGLAGAAGAEPRATVTELVREGGRVDWGANGLVAYDAPGPDGGWDVWIVQPDGTGRRNLTAGIPGLPQAASGNPAWHPSGRWLAIQSLDATLAPLGTLPPPSHAGKAKRRAELDDEAAAESPGIGVHNNLWIVAADGSAAWPVTGVDRWGGVLSPHFSPDGRRLAWAELTDARVGAMGRWVLKVADFEEQAPSSFPGAEGGGGVGSAPAVSNVRTLTPADLEVYEPTSFAPDGASLVFTGMPAGGNFRNLDIFRLELDTGRLARLTNAADQHFDAQAQFAPDGSRVLWASTRLLVQSPEEVALGRLQTEYWLMQPAGILLDGNHPARLTRFNDAEATVVSDASWSPDGARFAAFVQQAGGEAERGRVVVIEIRNP